MSKIMKHSRLTASLLGFLGVSSLAFISPVQASTVTNAGFETGDFTGWMTTGDTTVQGTFPNSPTGDILPPGGDFQAVLTTGCPTATSTPACQAGVNEDIGSTRGTYNYSGTIQTDADPSITPGIPRPLQSFLNLDSGGLSIPDNIAFLLPKEGSAIKQTITSPTPFKISFQYNFLSNDGQNSVFGPSDYGFVTIHQGIGTVADVIVLEQSTNPQRTGASAANPVTGAPDFTYDNSPYQMFMSGILQPGTYTLGIGVVDGYDRVSTSALLVDQVEKTEIPEPTSTTALLGLGSLGLILKRKKKQP